jgi:hypothetical protein
MDPSNNAEYMQSEQRRDHVLKDHHRMVGGNEAQWPAEPRRWTRSGDLERQEVPAAPAPLAAKYQCRSSRVHTVAQTPRSPPSRPDRTGGRIAEPFDELIAILGEHAPTWYGHLQRR